MKDRTARYGPRKVKGPQELLWAKAKADGTGCWVWQGKARTGSKKWRYGIVRLSNPRRQIGAHRYAYELMHGSIPAGQVVRHKCDNPLCINPHHLEVGTRPDNTQDAVDRNRMAKGESCGSAKLTEADVHVIRAATGTNAEVAEQFNVSMSTISEIRLRKTWKHI